MNNLMFIILYILVSFFALTFLIGYLMHITSKQTYKDLDYGYTNYKTFKNKFEEVSFFVYSKNRMVSDKKDILRSKNRIEEESFIFDNKIMIIRNPIGYLLAVTKIKKYIKQNYRKPIQNKIKW